MYLYNVHIYRYIDIYTYIQRSYKRVRLGTEKCKKRKKFKSVLPEKYKITLKNLFI